MLAAVALAAGCRTADSGVSQRMASIIVTNRTSEQIEAAVQAVFKQHGYEEGKSEDDEMDFQKPGSFMSGMVYGDWYSGGVWERIKVYQRDLDSSRTVVECDGFMVQEHEDPLFQNEKKEHKTKKGHLQELLNEVPKELRRSQPLQIPAPEK
ncbi:MAG TPA: hypothetical protein VMU04_22745 [Candidatus Acidoferrum sp.]|nr:hypothetical protein [Candidatus Acidoferrum sp.]